MRKGNMSAIWSWRAPKLKAAILSPRRTTFSTPSIICDQCAKTTARTARTAVKAHIDLGNCVPALISAGGTLAEANVAHPGRCEGPYHADTASPALY
jgi:hypothetical protein